MFRNGARSLCYTAYTVLVIFVSLFFYQEQEKEAEPPPKRFIPSRTHIRHKSDITDVVTVMRMEEGLQPFDTRLQDEVEEQPAVSGNQGNLSVTVIEEEEASDEISEEESSKNASRNSASDSAKTSTPLFPSVDIEVNVTISIDSGSILLHSGTTG